MTTEFYQDVVDEVKGLRAILTPEDKEKLSAKDFNGWLMHTCIYGQLTGNSTSIDAAKLKKQATTKQCIKGVFETKSNKYVRKDLVYTPLEKYAFHFRIKVVDHIYPYLLGVTQELTVNELERKF